MPRHRLLPVTITANEPLKPRLHRLSFTSEAFTDFPLSGPDEYFGLVMPQEGADFTPFEIGDSNIRAAVAAIPEEARPDLRWYTIRGIDPASKTMWTDVVVHGDSGPGSRWIQRAQPGDTAGIYTCDALWVPPTDSQLLVADASSIPALRHILEHQLANSAEDLQRTDVFAVITNHDEVEDGLVEQWSPLVRTLTVVDAEATHEPESTVAALQEHYASQAYQPPASVWACGERDLAKTVRELAIKSWGRATEDVVWIPFWIHGRARP